MKTEDPAEKGKIKKSVLYRASRIVRKNLGSIIVFEILYKTLAYFLFIPLLGRLSTFMLQLSGTTYLADNNMKKVILNPLTWLIMIVILYLIAALTAIELEGLMNAIHASKEGIHISVAEILNDAIYDAARIFHPKNSNYFIYILLILPFSSLMNYATLTEEMVIPDFIIEGIEQNLYFEIGFLILNCFLIFLAVRWIYAIPAMSVRDTDFNPSVRESTELTKKRFFPIFGGLIFCYIMVGIVFLVLAVPIGLAARGISLFMQMPLSWATVLQIIYTIVDMAVYVFAPLVTFCWIYTSYTDAVSQMGGKPIPSYKRTPTFDKGRRWIKWSLLAAVAAGTIFFFPGRLREVKMQVRSSVLPTMVMAHRGDSADAPENTLEAFSAAADNSANAAEMDVQMTKDGTIVVMHDSSLTRTTGVKKDIWNVTYDEIKDLDN